ncbi:MAG: molybdopterin molybdotransferase MoeA [Myxococcales bacterium]|nr:molybdopterin molybdotransferase MoeA [Myxococcales bacterium]
MLDFDAARERILAAARPVSGERVPLWSAVGRVLAEDVHAAGDWPPFDYSAMDGYALRAADVTGAGPWELPVSAHQRTGQESAPLEPGTAARIFTGAALPKGADCVVMQEVVEREGDRVRLASAPRAGDNVRRRGEDLEAGALALRRGTRLSPYDLGLLASLDRVEVLVARRPQVTLLCTGDELRPPGGGPPHTIADSNGVAVSALAAQAGGIPRRAPLTRDEIAPTRDAIAEAAGTTDLLITIGGVSVGEHDVVRPALEELGATVDFWKVRMKPGKPLLLARLGDTTVLGLPGNPASALVTFTLFGLPLLRHMQGDRRSLPPLRRAELTAPLRQKTGRRGFYRAALDGDRVTPLSNQASGAVTAMAWANCLVVVPEDVSELSAGSLVEVLSFADC